MNKANKEKLANRRRMLLELIKASGSTTLKELADSIGFDRIPTIAKDIQMLQKNHPEIVRPKGSNKVYWTITEAESDKIERYPLHKNHEGYNDPTAAHTLKTVKTEEILKNKTDILPGDIWECSDSKAGTKEYIVLAVDDENNFATCICNSDDPALWHRICTKPMKYFLKPIGFVPKDTKELITKELLDYFGIKTGDAPEPIVKVVEKVVEVEAPPKVIDTIYTAQDMEMALLHQKAEIYESIVKGGYMYAR